MPDQTTDFAAAIKALLTAGADADSPGTHLIKVDDKGTAFDIPVHVTRDAAGKVNAVDMIDVVNRAQSFARAQRLLNADGPDRREGLATMQSIGSLVAHVNRFKDTDSVVWADGAQRRIVAILDYHRTSAAGSPRWGKHRSVYACPLSEAWRAWGGGVAVECSQDELIALLDTRDRELTTGTLPDGTKAPLPSSLLTIASNLESYSNAKAKRERDPQTGRVRIAFSEEKGFLGDVLPPPSFLICIPVFEGEKAQPLEVRLRFAVDDGAATFSVQIHAAGDVLREAFRAICDVVADGTALPVFVGCPE